MFQGLETGHATLGVVGTVSRLLVPMVVAEMRRSAPGVSLRLTEGASERLAGEVAGRQRGRAARGRGGGPPRRARGPPGGGGVGGLRPGGVGVAGGGADRAGRP